MPKNKLYYGDNLDILRKHVPDESVDLIYLDPPFNSRRSYNVLFKEANGTAAAGDAAQVEAIEAEIDRLAAQLWGLTVQELGEIQRNLEELG